MRPPLRGGVSAPRKWSGRPSAGPSPRSPLSSSSLLLPRPRPASHRASTPSKLESNELCAPLAQVRRYAGHPSARPSLQAPTPHLCVSALVDEAPSTLGLSTAACHPPVLVLLCTVRVAFKPPQATSSNCDGERTPSFSSLRTRCVSLSPASPLHRARAWLECAQQRVAHADQCCPATDPPIPPHLASPSSPTRPGRGPSTPPPPLRPPRQTMSSC